MKKLAIVLLGAAATTASSIFSRIDPNPAIQRELSRTVCEEMAHQQGQSDLGVCIRDLRDALNDGEGD